MKKDKILNFRMSKLNFRKKLLRGRPAMKGNYQPKILESYSVFRKEVKS